MTGGSAVVRLPDKYWPCDIHRWLGTQQAAVGFSSHPTPPQLQPLGKSAYGGDRADVVPNAAGQVLWLQQLWHELVEFCALNVSLSYALSGTYAARR